jgi:dGTPase
MAQNDSSGYGADAYERFVPESAKASPSGDRPPFTRDRARVLHSSALRRLAGKTQVVEPSESDFPRTRLTHSLECAQIGREIAASLGSDPDLVDAACLAHDLGHPPFGHNGEHALNEIASGATGFVDCGGFEGNAQSLRLLTRLEAKVPGAGLNLTRATLDAACKYPWTRPVGGGKFGAYQDDLAVFDWLRQGSNGSVRPIETQIMDWADDVAYSVHDYEDGVQTGRIDPTRLDADAVIEVAHRTYRPDVSADRLREVWSGLCRQPWWLSVYDGSPRATMHLKAMASEVIGRFSQAGIEATRAQWGAGSLRRYAATFVVPEDTQLECALLKAVAVHYVMRPREPLQERRRVLIVELVTALVDRAPEAMDSLLRPSWEAAADDAARLRVVVDQVAGLTDAAAVALHRRLR